MTDNGNYIIDLFFSGGDGVGGDAEKIKELSTMLEQCGFGIVDHGMFSQMASECLVAGSDGVAVHELQWEGFWQFTDKVRRFTDKVSSMPDKKIFKSKLWRSVVTNSSDLLLQILNLMRANVRNTLK